MARMRPLRVVIGALIAGLVMIPLAAFAATAPFRAAATKRASRAPAVASVLPWIEDDHSRAVAEAKARKLPIFVESWAPW